MTVDNPTPPPGSREEREEKETYGRGGGERFQEEAYPRSYPVPGDMDWRRALRAYVDGHDRGREAERKFRDARAEMAPRRAPAREEAPAREPPPGVPDAAPAEGTGTWQARYGVPVPDRDGLRFHRGPGTWRDRLPAPPRTPGRGESLPDGPATEGTAGPRDEHGVDDDPSRRSR